jgi:L-arabinose isomerase
MFASTYMTSGQFAAIAHGCRSPILVVALQPEAKMDHATATTSDFLRYAGIAALPELCNVLQRCGAQYELVVGHLGDEDTWARIGRWIRAAMVVARLGFSRYGLMGHLYPGMLDIASSVTSLIRPLGGNIDVIEMEDLRAAVEAAPEEAVRDAMVLVAEKFQLAPDVDREHLAFQSRVAVGMEQLVRDRQLDTLAYFYFGRDNDLHERIVGSMAIGGTLLTTAGVPVGTEFDLRATMAMHIMNLLGSATMFTELYSLNLVDDVVELGHDGATNYAMTAVPPKVKPLAVFHGKSGSGNAVESTVRSGRVTLFSIGELGDGSIRFVAASGDVVEGPLMSIGNTVSRVRFEGSAPAWVEAWSCSGSGHHFAMAADGCVEELVAVAELLKVELVTIDAAGSKTLVGAGTSVGRERGRS